MIFRRHRRPSAEADAAVDQASDAVRDYYAGPVDAGPIDAGPVDDRPAWGEPASSVDTPTGPSDAPDGFRFVVEDLFTITGRGTVATGTVEYGTIRVGDKVVIHGRHGTTPSQVSGVEALRRRAREVHTGQNAGLLLAGVRHDDIAPGDVITG